MSMIDLSAYSFDAIIFDCDGTLVNSAPLHFRAFQIALAQQGASLEKSWYMDRLGLARHELITEFSNEYSANIDVPYAVAQSQEQYVNQIKHLSDVPEVVGIAKQYFGMVPMAVASSGQKLSVCESLESVGLLHLFDLILTAEDVLACKPDPEIYVTAANKLQINVSKCLVFEDAEEGLASASAAGAQVIDVRSFAAIYADNG